MSKPPAVLVEALDYRYPRRLFAPQRFALAGVDLQVQPGEIVGILGPNGSGKTTLLKVLAGILRAGAGTCRVLGHEPRARPLARRVAYQPEGPLPFPMLTALEFLRLQGALRGLAKTVTVPAARTWLERVGLGSVPDRAIRALSTGMTRRLALAAVLLAGPEVLLLDEPTAGIDPLGSLRVRDLLLEQRARGAAILMASHQLDEVEQLCNRVYLLTAGTVRAHGTLDELLGTAERTLLVRGLDDAGLDEVRRTIAARGAELVTVGRARKPLQSLFRELESE